MKPISRASTWLFPEGSAFPVVSGDLHPLKLHARGLLGRGIVAAVGLHFILFGAWIIQRSLATGDLPVPGLPGPERVVIFDPPPIPPPIDPAAPPPDILTVPPDAPPFESGAPVPTVDTVDFPTIWTPPDEGQGGPPADGEGTGGVETIYAPVIPEETDPAPGDFYAVEEMPYPIQSPAPVYPDMARAAEVEGMVLVRALVNKEGRIEKAFVVTGHPMLDDAALAAVRAWVFRPAMQQHRPVKVWVSVPIRFVLH